MLKITKTVSDAMIAASRKAAPLEACGLLGGVDAAASEFYELSNIDASGDHYGMMPEEQFAAIKDMRAKGLRMLAIWHSHPASPARMSEEDMRLAFTPEVVYVIISLENIDAPVIRGFVVDNGTSKEIEIAHD